MTAAGRRARGGGGLRADEEGSFLMLEAILVAMLVLTAILFFTTVQRPSTGSGEGGLDLTQVSADTLQILQQRPFVIGGQAHSFEEWLTKAARGDAATADAVEGFLDQVLPTGAHYSLRLDNGVSALQVLPSGATEVPRNARAAGTATVPLWAAFRNETVARVVNPGQVVDATDPLVSGTYTCYEAPYNSTLAPSAAAWSTRWTSAPETTAPTTNGKDTAGALDGRQQVPRDLPLGKWKLSTSTAGTHCGDLCATYVLVAPPGSRALSVDTLGGQAAVTATTAADARFSSADVGLPVTGESLPVGTTILSVESASQATLSVPATGTSTIAVSLPVDPTFTPYGVHLVVWFGA